MIQSLKKRLKDYFMKNKKGYIRILRPKAKWWQSASYEYIEVEVIGVTKEDRDGDVEYLCRYPNDEIEARYEVFFSQDNE